ncbi:MAG: biotin--[acetyl-CoA-carboxylase] ligase [Gammaproteobacteria bacterium]|nr:biotin--[acetyl-CoA-carboxylase] ligase [Gammaproteobacteria bacterium]
MTRLDAVAIRQSLDGATTARLAKFEAFTEIDSTNSYLMQQPGPPPGQVRVAVTDNQTNGRGRHGRTWQSPPGSGLCLSLAYTFAEQPANLPALTLAIGLGVIDALELVGVCDVRLKWPNDLIAADGKLGGILTETQSQASGAITVVTGVGLNIDLGDGFDLKNKSSLERGVVDLARFAGRVPAVNELAGHLISGLVSTISRYETQGFAGFQNEWRGRDWLLGREVTVNTPHAQVAGVGAGIAADGALLVDTGTGTCDRITSGTILETGNRGLAE